MIVGKLELADELSHLSVEQIETLYERYLGDEKVKDLIVEYDIPCRPSGLAKLFPPKLLVDEHCPHCAAQMYAPRRSKSSSFIENKKVCFSCKHSESDSWGHQCLCSYCTNERNKLRQEEHERREAERNAVHEKIKEKYSLDARLPVHIDSLSFRNKVLLLSLLEALRSESLVEVEPLSTELKVEPFACSIEVGEVYLQELAEAGVVVVAPNSPITAFDISNEYELIAYRDVRWVVNVTLGGDLKKRASLEDTMSTLSELLGGKVPQSANDQLWWLIFEISADEVLSGLCYWLARYDVRFNPGEKTVKAICKLLEDFTVSQIKYFCKLAVEEVCLYVEKTPGTNKREAAKLIPSKLLSRGKRALENGVQYKNFSRRDFVPRAYTSKVVFDHVLSTVDGGYTMLPREYEIPIYVDDTDDSDNCCAECGGYLSNIVDDDGWAERVCMECGFVA